VQQRCVSCHEAVHVRVDEHLFVEAVDAVVQGGSVAPDLDPRIDRKTRDAITERVALLTTQGRALGFTVRGYVQEPTKDTVPVRDLFPRRICLRVSAKSHVGMVLGDQAYERGAWANRIIEAEPGVGYVFGEGVREPMRVRAGWVPDQTIKKLETFITGPITHDTAVLPFPTKPTDPTGSTHGGAA
jgi:S-DNA-T family DNA segregation ATPase FtsK/SpoIIIE